MVAVDLRLQASNASNALYFSVNWYFFINLTLVIILSIPSSFVMSDVSSTASCASPSSVRATAGASVID